MARSESSLTLRGAAFPSYPPLPSPPITSYPPLLSSLIRYMETRWFSQQQTPWERSLGEIVHANLAAPLHSHYGCFKVGLAHTEPPWTRVWPPLGPVFDHLGSLHSSLTCHAHLFLATRRSTSTAWVAWASRSRRLRSPLASRRTCPTSAASRPSIPSHPSFPPP